MANLIRYSTGIALLVVLLSVIYVNSSPINDTIVILPLAVGSGFPAPGRKCFANTDCNNHGRCSENGTSCECDRGWTTVAGATELDVACTYPQRSKQTAFFLSFFLGPLGVDWFYLSRGRLIYIFVGIFKLLLSSGCCGSWPLMYLGPETENFEAIKSKFRGVSTCFTLLAFAWWIVDWTRVLGNRFPDGNLVALFPW